MKKIKSIFAFLMLSSLTLSGCAFLDFFKSKKNDTPADTGGGGEEGGGEHKEDKYTVSFNANGGTGSMSAASEVSGEYTLPECGFTAPEGKEFNGWKIGAEGEVKQPGEKITVEADITLIAQWKDGAGPVVKYTVIFDVQGHGQAPQSVEVNEGGKVAKPTDPSAEGWAYKGWYKEATCQNAWNFETDTVTANVTLYAKWTEVTPPTPTVYTVTFNVQGHGEAPTSIKVEEGGKVTKPTDPSATGWTFGGWYKEAGCITSWDFDNDTVTEDVVIYAKWTEDTPTPTVYTVAFDVQGHGDAPAAQQVEDGGLVTKPADPSADGYDFGGWYEEAECEYEWHFDSDVVFENITLYAKWTEKTEPGEPVSVTFVVEDAMFEDGAHLFVHYWGEGKDAKTVEITLENKNVSFEAGYTQYIVVRTTAESYDGIVWEGEDDNCWGQTGNCNVAEGTFSITYTGEGEELVVSPYSEPVEFVPHVLYGGGESWEEETLVSVPVEGHPERVAAELVLEAGDEFVVEIEKDVYLHYSDFHNTLEAHGQITHCEDSEHEGHEEHANNLIAVSDGIYTIIVQKDVDDALKIFVEFEPLEGDTKVYPPCVHYSVGEEWFDAPLVEDPSEEHPEQYKIEKLELGKDSEFAINMGTGWIHSDQFHETEDCHGAVSAHGENVQVSEEGTYNIFVNSSGIYVVYESYDPEAPAEAVTVTFVFDDSMLSDGAHLYVHYFNNDKPELEAKNAELTAENKTVVFEAGYTQYIVVRTTAESFDDIVWTGEGDNCWGQTGNCNIVEGTFTVAYGEGHEVLVVSKYVEPETPVEPEEPGKTSKVTMTFVIDEKIFEEGTHYFVHCWGEGKEDLNIEISKDNPVVEIEDGYTGFIIVRTGASSFEEIVWSGEDDNCWGQTGNCDVAEGTFTVAYGEGHEVLVVSEYVEA